MEDSPTTTTQYHNSMLTCYYVLCMYIMSWLFTALFQERVLNLFNGVIAVLHRNRMKDIIKVNDWIL